MNMFGRQGHSGNSSSNLVEFRAGRMNMVGRMVHPDTRKGLVYLTQSDDGLMHFCWKDRTTGKVEDDLIVFPDEYEFKRVEQCKTGRVYVLKFKTSSRRMFFWMQDPKIEKDEEYCRRVNELMNNPPSATRGGGSSDGNDLQYMLNNMSQQQLMQLFGGVGQIGGLSSLLGSMNRSGDSSSRGGNSSSRLNANSGLLTPDNAITMRTPSAPKGKGSKANNSGEGTESSSGGGGGGGGGGSSGSSGSGGAATDSAGKTTARISNSKLQSFLSNLSPEAGRSLNIDLSTAIAESDAINEIISDPQRTRSLSVHLPESYDSDESKKQQIKDTINSPQFQQALSLFSNALQSSQLGPVVSQFELTPDAIAAAYSGNLEDFVKALEKALPAGATMSGDSKSSSIDSPTDSSDKSKDPKKDKPDETPEGKSDESKKIPE